MPSYLDRVDLPFYRRNLEEQLPERIIDIHCHVGRMEHVDRSISLPAFWADRMCQAFSADAMMQTYRMLMPGKKVQPVWFAFPRRNVHLDEANSYAARAAHEYGTSSLLVTRPTWTQDEVWQRAKAGGHRGLKPYFYLVEGKPAADVTVFDCLPHAHLDLANKHGWIVVLHLPRSRRLADPSNLAQVKEICTTYPNIKLIIAHVGRAYCRSFALAGLPALKNCDKLYWDFSANCNQEVMEMLLQQVEPQRILYGSDLPLVAMRLKRICEGDNYINLVRKTRYNDAQTRRDPENEDTFTSLLYESIAAFLRAAQARGLSRADIGDVFHDNAQRLLQ
jgi:hypothetical protein